MDVDAAAYLTTITEVLLAGGLLSFFSSVADVVTILLSAMTAVITAVSGLSYFFSFAVATATIY